MRIKNRKKFLEDNIFQHYNEKQVLLNFLNRVNKTDKEYMSLVLKYYLYSIPNKYEDIQNLYAIYMLKKPLRGISDMNNIMDNYDELYVNMGRHTNKFEQDILSTVDDLSFGDAIKVMYGLVDEIEETGSSEFISILDSYLQYMWGGEAEQ